VTRHFLGLYLLIVLTLAAVSWGQDRLLQLYGAQDPLDERAQAVALSAIGAQLANLPAAEWKPALAKIGAQSGVKLELFSPADIAGGDTVAELSEGRVAYLNRGTGEAWALRKVADGEVLALESPAPDAVRGPLEWAVTSFFYAAIALVIMVWIWPLRRDLRALERAAARYGDNNWRFEADIKRRSQVRPLADTFRGMAARIESLIASHKDMANAVSHEIKTPLSRMQFEIELAQQSTDPGEIGRALGNIKSDIAAINGLVTATLSYAVLERAGVALNLAPHDFTKLIPAITDYVRADLRTELLMSADVSAGAERVTCDAHWFEAVLKNLLYNAARFARHEVRVRFEIDAGRNRLVVDDDGPGIPEQARQRVFESFVQLEQGGAKRQGFGLGLAIVRRAIEWHGGEVAASVSPLGGARFTATWPNSARPAAAGPRS
jgi:two-component system OmpR family sensor kinase